jgi:hypothetical protein
VSDDKLDFPILHDLKAEGATDYFALPIKSSFGSNYMATFVTDRVGGFSEKEISSAQRLAIERPVRGPKRGFAASQRYVRSRGEGDMPRQLNRRA